MSYFNKKSRCFILLPYLLLSMFGVQAVQGQADTSKQVANTDTLIAHADSAHFSVNTNNGWMLFNSYVNPAGNDSAHYEVIIEHARTGIDWAQFQHIGKIKESIFLPVKEQLVNYYLMSNLYVIRIGTDGKCFIRLKTGSLPDGDPVIIPVQISYSLK